MNDFKAMARILSAVKQCESERRMDFSLFQSEVLKTDETTRDSLIVKLQKDGYIEGFMIIDDIDNQAYPFIAWTHSNPKITIKGMTFIEENKTLKKAMKEIRDTEIDIAKGKIINGMFMF